MNSQTLILVDKNDSKVGYSTLEETHTGRGKKHRAFVTLLFNNNDEVLLQKRKHRLFDGFWDFTAISHPLRVKGKDENYQEASDRALKKEMGISHVDIQNMGGFNYFARDGKNCENEYCAVLVGYYNGKFSLSSKEVYEAKWVNFAGFLKDFKKRPQKYTPWAKKAVNILVDNLSSATLDKSNLFKEELQKFIGDFEKYSKTYFSQKQKVVKKYPVLISKFYKELEGFSAGGKAMRPFLVYLGYVTALDSTEVRPLKRSDLYRGLLPVCMAVELVHNFLLIHDDIIDESDIRRGKPTMHKKFEKTVHPSLKATDGKHYGISQAILAGDIALLEAFNLVNKSDFTLKLKSQSLEMLIKVILETGYGEALDIENEHKRSNIGEIWQVVELKTARYSFVAPLILGAILAGTKKSQLDALEQYGLSVGKAYQLKDDILGVFADEKTIGKSTLSDMREGKNTILFHKTLEMASSPERGSLARLWGDRRATVSDLLGVRKIMKDCGALVWCQEEMGKLAKDAKKSVDAFTSDSRLAAIFEQCADFVIHREN